MICTTVKQVKELLSGGLDISTADMAYVKSPKDGHYILVATPPMSKSDLPCWSMAALWEICRDNGIELQFDTDEDKAETIIAVMVLEIANM